MITKEKVQKFRVDFEKAVAKLEKDYDVEINLGSIRYSSTDFHGTLTVKTKTVAGMDHAQFEFEKLCNLYGLSKEYYGKSFPARNGLVLTVAGINSKARKDVVMLEGSDGKSYKASVEFVKSKIK